MPVSRLAVRLARPLFAFLICLFGPEVSAELLFSGHAPLDITIEAPFSKINNDRRDKAQYRAGILSYVKPDGSQQKLDVQIKTRGIFRRQRETCEYPPLRLNFKKKQVVETLFAGQDKLKLVTHCLRNDGKAEQNLMKEYLAYRIFNQLTDRSFRVRLLSLTYVDTSKRRREKVNAGFVIEHKQSLASRNQAEVRDEVRIRSADLDRPHTSLVEVFEYLIANTDFSLSSGSDESCCHNMVPIVSEDGSIHIVPYDFDFAGMVDPGYAQPNPKLRIRNVKQRLYRGLCRSNDYLDATLERFEQARSAIYALPADMPGMSERTERSVVKFIDGFYAVIADPAQVKRKLVNECR